MEAKERKEMRENRGRKAQVIDSRLQDQESRIQSKIQDSREEIKKQQIKTS